jgi:hypothetical protein
MNKFLCEETKKRNKAKGLKFDRSLCGLCTYSSRCIDYQEFKHGHSDELRDSSKKGEE